MRFKGIGPTLQLLVEKDNVIDQENVDPIALEKMSSSVYLDDHDIYIVWMSVLYYYIFHKIPDSISRHWYTSLVTAGRPTMTKPLFTINWSDIVAESPLSRQEQFGVTNLLLSMVRFFGKKARGNDTKRPLLMGAWQTLLDFLAHTKCYKVAGTLTLLRKGLDIKALLPEMYDTAAYLEMQVNGKPDAIQRLQRYTASLSDMPHKLILAYRSAHMLALSESSPHDELCKAARLIGLPMEDIYDMSGMPSNEAGNVQVDFVRRLYLNALGMDPTPPAPAKPAFQKGGMASCFKSAVFGWINLIFLTQISLWLYPNPVLQSTLLQQLRTAREMAIEAVQADEAKLLLVKYTKHYV
ncbi:hypothetical protein BX666DRAFT_532574 [Dichotomocladium elegans]|nr:hypothetical protein BX666DRAFT_532574 [Dichotomocladium elegans]